LILTDNQLKILYLSPTLCGAVHDKKMADQTLSKLPEGSCLFQDLGFMGFTLDKVTVLMPYKKPKGCLLTHVQKVENSVISSYRVRIEHVISSVKRCRIVKEKCRLGCSIIRDMVMEVACALHNFRVRLVPWKPVSTMF
jgi:hypothetical protein